MTMTVDFVRRMAQRIAKAEEATPSMLAEIKHELERAPSAELWILFGDAIQLGNDDEYDLTDAEASYRRALEIEPLSAAAYESLAFFTFAVRADAQGSLPLFERAIELGAGASARDGLQAAINDLAESDDEML